MRRSLVTPERALGVIVVVMLVLSLLPVQAAAAIARAPHWVLNLVLVPLQQPLHAMGVALRAEPEREIYGDDVQQLREQLALARSLNQRYEEELRQAREDLARLTMMAEHLQLRGVRTVDATVASYSGEPTNPTLTISRGTADGIAAGQAVVWGINLVGQVVATSTRTATVGLITAPHTQINVVLAPPEPGGQRRIEEQVQLAKDGQSFFVDVDLRQKPVQVGDLAFLTDAMGRFPRESVGTVVGQVVDITDETSEPLLLQRVIIRPLAPLSELRQVTVMQPVE